MANMALQSMKRMVFSINNIGKTTTPFEKKMRHDPYTSHSYVKINSRSTKQ